MYWASPILRAVSLIFFFCQVDMLVRNSCTSGKRPSHFVVRQKFEIISLILTSLFVIVLAVIITRLQSLSFSGSPENQFLAQTVQSKKHLPSNWLYSLLLNARMKVLNSISRKNSFMSVLNIPYSQKTPQLDGIHHGINPSIGSS